MAMFWGGSAKKLKGNCVAVGIFVSEEGNPWSEEDKEATWENLEKAMAWIAERAEEYEIELNMETHCINWEEDVVLAEIPKFGDDQKAKKPVLGDIAQQLEYENITDFYQGIKSEYEGYSMHFIFLNNVDSRCHMSSANIDDPDKLFEYNMVYNGKGKIGAFILAHETLHAYSAMDIYDVYGTKEGSMCMEYAKKKFPKEVMLEVVNDIEGSVLSEFTAFLIGWHDEPKSWYPKLVQPHDEKEFAKFLKNHKHFDEDGDLIIEDEEEIARYQLETGEIVRYQINGEEGLVHWRFYGEDEEEIEYWEKYINEHYYYLGDKESATRITVPIKGGKGYIAYKPEEDYQPWENMRIETA